MKKVYCSECKHSRHEFPKPLCSCVEIGCDRSILGKIIEPIIRTCEKSNLRNICKHWEKKI